MQPRDSTDDQRKLFAFRPGFVAFLSFATSAETFHPTSLLRYAAALAGSVVATVSAPADADYDNGVTLHDAARCRRGHEHAAKRVETSIGEKHRPDLILVAHQ